VEAKKNIDLFIKLKDSAKAIEEIQKYSYEIEKSVRDAQKQVDYRMDEEV